MSTFRRTASGLNNQHLFYNVDLIVFLEGGSTSFSKLDVYADKYNLETEDIIFWKNVFNKFSSGKKLKFKSVGSKTTIKEIAIDIINGKLKTVIVAMDNEFDEILSQRIDHPNIYYTHGYSFENDVWNDKVIKEVIEELTAIKIEHNEIEENFKNFLKKIKIAVYADAYLFKKKSSFFPRKSGHLFCIECNPVDLPLVKDIDLNAKLISKGLKKSTIYNYGRKNSLDPLKFCYGHLLADYCCQLIMHYVKKRHSLSTISKDFIYRMGINKFFQNNFINGQIYNYYETQFKKNIA
jgi:hypothetical protein